MNESDKWIVRPSAAQGYLILKPAPNGISLHQLIGRVVKEENANLVAVAPELLEACIEIVAYGDCYCEVEKPCAICIASEAIYKATGKEFYKTDSPAIERAKGGA